MPDVARLGVMVAALLAAPQHAATRPPDMVWSAVRLPVEAPAPLVVVESHAEDAWLGQDKFRHFWMSYATTSFVFAAARAGGADTRLALQVAVPVSVGAGVGKEILDRRAGGVFSVRDMVANALGVAAAVFLLREVH